MPNSLLNQMMNQMSRAWAETDAAQRRLFEIRTGIPVPPRSRRRERGTPSELQRLLLPSRRS